VARGLCALAVLLGTASVPLAALNGLSPAELVSSHVAIGAAFAVSFPVFGALIVVRQPRNRFGWVLVAMGAFLGPYELAQQYAPLALGLSAARRSLPGGALASWLAAWANLSGLALGSTFLLLLFPDGALPSRRWRPLAWAAAAATVVPAAAVAVLSWPLRGPMLAEALPPRVDAVWTGGFVLALLLLAPCVAAVVVRFRRSTGVRASSTSWFADGGVCLPLNAFSQVPRVGPVLELLQVPTLFGAIATAIFRHRLYDIDRLANRTLVDSLLSAISAAARLSACCSSGRRSAPVGTRPAWSWRRPCCSSRCAGPSKARWTGASTGAATTPPVPWRRSATACATTGRAHDRAARGRAADHGADQTSLWLRPVRGDRPR
jgi:hypothetical protein